MLCRKEGSFQLYKYTSGNHISSRGIVSGIRCNSAYLESCAAREKIKSKLLCFLNIIQYYKAKLRWFCAHSESRLRAADFHLANQIHTSHIYIYIYIIRSDVELFERPYLPFSILS